MVFIDIEYQREKNKYHTSYNSDLYTEYAQRVTAALQEKVRGFASRVAVLRRTVERTMRFIDWSHLRQKK